MRWPDGFMWGTGASSTQCEGAAPASDWWAWERSGHAPLSGDGNGFAARLSLEPEAGVYDRDAIQHYRHVLSAARAARIVPWVCLHHFTLPRWFAATGGFLIERNRTEVWRRHVDFVADTFGDLVGGWQPVNETNYYAHAAYRGGGWPPGHNDREECARAAEAIHLATAEAAVRLRRTGAPVASIFGLSALVAQDDAPATAQRLERIRQTLWRPGLELFRDGVLRIPHRTPLERPDLAGCFDLIGFSYYAAIGVCAGRPTIHPLDAPLSPLGYGIWADGLGVVLDALHAELPNVPLLIAEYGVGTDDDGARARYLSRGIEITHAAMARGIDIRGFFHWTAVDNYEWLHGYNVAFGIIDRDRNVRDSARVLQRAAG